MISLFSLIKKIKIKRPSIKWHAWPELDKILSIYEALVYLIIATIFILLYGLIQIVPVHKDTITCDRLCLDNSKKSIEDTFSYGSVIQYYIPMTFVLNGNEDMGKVRIRHIIYLDSLREKEKETLETIEKQSLSKYLEKCDSIDSLYIQNRMKNYHDSLIYSYCAYNPFPSDSSKFIYYSSVKQEHSILSGIAKFHSINVTNEFSFTNNYEIDNSKVNEVYSLKTGEYSLSDVGGSINGPLSRPSIFSPYDISQSYIHINLRGNSDSTRLAFEFVGAIELSNMTPEPDTITMSKIVFCKKEKIEDIKKHGLKFHAKFTELQNTQNFRLFFLSAILSALCAIFVTFFVIVIYINLFKKKLS